MAEEAEEAEEDSSASAADEREPTFWQGRPCEARQVSVVVVDDSRYAGYWARDLIGQRRNAVEVTDGGRTFYLDDEPFAGSSEPGWAKVTIGRGTDQYGHRELGVEPGSIQERVPDEPEPEPEPDAGIEPDAEPEPGEDE